jgi:hypothetical protein
MLERLGEIVVGAGAQGLHRSPHLGVSGDQDHRQLGIEILGFAHQLHAIHARHPQVRQQHVGVPGADQLQRLDSVFGQQRRQPLADAAGTPATGPFRARPRRSGFCLEPYS